MEMAFSLSISPVTEILTRLSEHSVEINVFSTCLGRTHTKNVPQRLVREKEKILVEHSAMFSREVAILPAIATQEYGECREERNGERERENSTVDYIYSFVLARGRYGDAAVGIMQISWSG